MSNKRVSSVRLIWLEAFVAVAETGSFKEAGKQLSLDPTVVRRYIDQLENWMERPLTARTSRKFALGHYGNEFLPKAKNIISTLLESRDIRVPLKDVLKEFARDRPRILEEGDVVDANFEEVT